MLCLIAGAIHPKDKNTDQEKIKDQVSDSIWLFLNEQWQGQLFPVAELIGQQDQENTDRYDDDLCRIQLQQLEGTGKASGLKTGSQHPPDIRKCLRKAFCPEKDPGKGSLKKVRTRYFLPDGRKVPITE